MAVDKTKENPPHTNAMITIIVIHVAVVILGSSSALPSGLKCECFRAIWRVADGIFPPSGRKVGEAA